MPVRPPLASPPILLAAPRRPLARAALLLGLLLFGGGADPAVYAQSKPLPATTTGSEEPGTGTPRIMERLPAPRLSVDQTANGCVRLSWEAVPGASRYVLGRSQGTNGYQRVPDAPTGQTTVYLDRNVTAGVRVSYTVTPVDQSGLAGLRATSEKVIPVATPTSGCIGTASEEIRVTSVVAQRTATGFAVTWTAVAPTSTRFTVAHYLDGRSAGVQNVGLQARRTEFTDASPGEHRFEVSAIDDRSVIRARVSSNVVTVAADAPVGSSPAATATAAPAAPAEVSLTVGTPVTLRVGASATLAAPAGSRWSSVDAGIATVDAAGVVTAAAPGRARILAVVPQPDGALRVLVVHVVVSP